MDKLLQRLLAASLVFASWASEAGVVYEVIDIAPYRANERGYTDHSKISINDAGEVAGTSYTESGPQAFIYRSGSVQLLGTLGGSSSFAAGINARGDVVGHSPPSDTELDTHPFFWNGNAIKDLGTLGGPYAYALGANRLRQVVGFSYLPEGNYKAFLYDNGEMKDIGTLGGRSSLAHCIGDDGIVVGSAENAAGRLRAFRFENGTMIELGTLSGGEASVSRAYTINRKGIAAGDSAAHWGAPFRAVRFEGGQVHDLGTLGGAYSQALAINGKSEIVGWSTTKGTHNRPNGHQAVEFRGGKVVSLTKQLEPVSGAGWTLIEASGINDQGQIAGWGLHNGAYRVFLLNPMPASR